MQSQKDLECNFFGNSIALIFVRRWESEFDFLICSNTNEREKRKDFVRVWKLIPIYQCLSNFMSYDNSQRKHKHNMIVAIWFSIFIERSMIAWARNATLCPMTTLENELVFRINDLSFCLEIASVKTAASDLSKVKTMSTVSLSFLLLCAMESFWASETILSFVCVYEGASQKESEI